MIGRPLSNPMDGVGIGDWRRLLQRVHGNRLPFFLLTGRQCHDIFKAGFEEVVSIWEPIGLYGESLLLNVSVWLCRRAFFSRHDGLSHYALFMLHGDVKPECASQRTCIRESPG